MKKKFLTGIVLVLVSGFLFAGANRADAMNNESAAMLAGAVMLFGAPILHAIATDAYRPAPAYVEVYPAPHYTTTTKIIYERPVYKRWHKTLRQDWRSERPGWDHDRGWRHGWRSRW